MTRWTNWGVPGQPPYLHGCHQPSAPRAAATDAAAPQITPQPRPSRRGPSCFRCTGRPARTEITAREGAPIALKICRLDGDDRALDAHVLIRRGLRLRAQTKSASTLEELCLPRNPGGYDL